MFQAWSPCSLRRQPPQWLLKARRSSFPTPGKAVWARPPRGTCSLQPLDLGWFTLGQEEAGAGPKRIPGVRVWGLRYSVTLRQGCGGQTRTPLRPEL